jgi:hypothetical protein
LYLLAFLVLDRGVRWLVIPLLRVILVLHMMLLIIMEFKVLAQILRALADINFSLAIIRLSHAVLPAMPYGLRWQLKALKIQFGDNCHGKARLRGLMAQNLLLLMNQRI